MTTDELAKFVSYIVKDSNGCWTWNGARLGHGYGRIHLKSDGEYRQYSAHRVAYEHYKGSIPSGYQIDHLCRNRACCNPDHLEAVTPMENTRRSIPFQNRSVTRIASVCLRGHDLTQADNLYYSQGRRICKFCQRLRYKQYRDRKKNKQTHGI